MATDRPFDYGKRDYIDKLNDLYNIGMPRIKSNSLDPESPGTDVTAARQVRLADNGSVLDCRGTFTITFWGDAFVDGFAIFINVITGTVTVDARVLGGVAFLDGNSTKTVTGGNAALISTDGIAFRIFRMVAS